MSLQHVAKHLASKGRGEDKVLVHMTPQEVKGLQSLAMAHGGSLTINPHTGLAEAGFLRNLLPALAGAGLMMIPGMQALGAAAIVGGGTALAKGDLKAGLMAGLGAYGGAGLAEGAMAGATPAPAASTVPAAPDLGVATSTPIPPQGPVQGVQLGSFNETGQAASGFQPSGPAFQSTVPDPSAMTPPPPGSNYAAPSSVMEAPSGSVPAFQAQPYSGPTEASLKPETTGFERAGQNFMADPKLGIAAIAPGLLPDREALPEEDPYSGPLSKYKFDPNQYRSSDRSQPNPYYTARRYNYAGGGPVEQMSNANAIGQNTGYPMADINKAAYSTPYQTPVSENVVTGSTDTGVDSMTGEQTRFAAGGITGSGNLDLHIPLDLGGGGGGGGGFGGGGGGGFGGGGQGGGAFGVGNGGGGQSQSAFGQGFQGSSMPGFSGGQPRMPQGGFGGMNAPAVQDPFANDDNYKNYQNQMQGMVKDLEGSDQYKNMMSLNDTIRNYQQQRLGTAGSPTLNTPAAQQAAAQAAYNPNGGGGGGGIDSAFGGGLGLQPSPRVPMSHGRPTGPGPDTEYMRMAQGGMAYAGGGISSLGSYSDGGRMLKGPGNGTSDSIPAQIGDKQPARLADGEFVLPARIVSEIGNGSTDAGARELYKMMDRVQQARGKTVGKNKVAFDAKARTKLPA